MSLRLVENKIKSLPVQARKGQLMLNYSRLQLLVKKMRVKINPLTTNDQQIDQKRIVYREIVKFRDLKPKSKRL